MNDNKLVKYYKKVVLQNYANFSGRARRAEYWNFVLANFLLGIAINIVLGILKIGALGGLYQLAVLVPSLAVGVRRLHDIGKSGWALLLVLIPLIGWIVLIVWAFKDGEQGPNKYGDSEKYPTAA